MTSTFQWFYTNPEEAFILLRKALFSNTNVLLERHLNNNTVTDSKTLWCDPKEPESQRRRKVNAFMLLKRTDLKETK